MAKFKIDSNIEEAFDVSNLLKLGDETLTKALNEAIDVTIKSIRTKGEEMGVHRTGVMLSSLKPSKAKVTKNGARIISATFRGKRNKGKNKSGKPIANSEVAFINEFGINGNGDGRVIKARPFVSEGNIAVADEVAAIIDKHIHGEKK